MSLDPVRLQRPRTLYTRMTAEVLRDHLKKRSDGLFEADLRDNYARDVVLLTCTGIFRGHDGLRESHNILLESLADARIDVFNILTDGEFAFIEWRATADHIEVPEGADSFIIRNGKIVAQSIHNKVREK